MYLFCPSQDGRKPQWKKKKKYNKLLSNSLYLFTDKLMLQQKKILKKILQMQPTESTNAILQY